MVGLGLEHPAIEPRRFVEVARLMQLHGVRVGYADVEGRQGRGPRSSVLGSRFGVGCHATWIPGHRLRTSAIIAENN